MRHMLIIWNDIWWYFVNNLDFFGASKNYESHNALKYLKPYDLVGQYTKYALLMYLCII